jgi:hypothetical protein
MYMSWESSSKCLSLQTYNAMASALLVAVLEPGEWDIREEDLVDALVECELKLGIECDCVGGEYLARKSQWCVGQ